MEQSLSWGINSYSARQEIPYLLWKPKVHLLCSEEPSTGPYPEACEYNQHFPIQYP